MAKETAFAEALNALQLAEERLIEAGYLLLAQDIVNLHGRIRNAGPKDFYDSLEDT